MQVTNYPLTFRPAYEATIEGCLILDNQADCHEHVFELIGRALEPLPLDKIVIKGAVNRPWSRIIDIPNITKKKLLYRVSTQTFTNLCVAVTYLTVMGLSLPT